MTHQLQSSISIEIEIRNTCNAMCKLQSPLAFVYYLLFIITGLIRDCSWSKNRLSKFVILYFATYGFKQQFDIFLPLRMNESYKLILYPINWDRYFLACCRQTFASFCSILYLDLSTLTHPQGAKKGECRETWPHRKKKEFHSRLQIHVRN